MTPIGQNPLVSAAGWDGNGLGQLAVGWMVSIREGNAK